MKRVLVHVQVGDPPKLPEDDDLLGLPEPEPVEEEQALEEEQARVSVSSTESMQAANQDSRYTVGKQTVDLSLSRRRKEGGEYVAKVIIEAKRFFDQGVRHNALLH
jgi:hypothetical protein